jgi:hypothetical protein
LVDSIPIVVEKKAMSGEVVLCVLFCFSPVLFFACFVGSARSGVSLSALSLTFSREKLRKDESDESSRRIDDDCFIF